MSSELTSGDPVERIEIPEGKFPTDVTGVFADGQLKAGTVEFPVFDVDKDDFYGNMTADRRRMRFKTDNVKGYMSGTKYKIPFYIKYTDENGKAYQRRVK